MSKENTDTAAAAARVDKELDLSNAGCAAFGSSRCPSTIANKWEKAPGNIEVGKLKISKQVGQKAQVSLTLSDAVINIDPAEEIPRDHRLDVSACRPDSRKRKALHGGTDRAEARVPTVRGQLLHEDEAGIDPKASQPARQLKSLEKIVQTFKPVSDHKHNIEEKERKKAEGKKSRDDKNAVLDMLFNAFEKHQYYNIKDLVKITRQPISYLKETSQRGL
ncbi:hypothetical protein pipiens_019003 [Culex pipiens pipiens]|uniref:General transcription factor IIF subunit 2 n=1 Tax=Culex pipiens pipiens TaxID=38569 RepID=A0ABD1DYN8_CULPP